MEDPFSRAVWSIDLDEFRILIEQIEFVIVECYVSIDEIAFKARRVVVESTG